MTIPGNCQSYHIMIHKTPQDSEVLKRRLRISFTFQLRSFVPTPLGLAPKAPGLVVWVVFAPCRSLGGDPGALGLLPHGALGRRAEHER